MRLLDELGVEQTEQIDVFAICEDLGLWLAFLPMDNLLGAFIPEGVGGVLVTTQRPIPIQRYTAAHEIGHWRLDHGHGLALDGEEHVLGTTADEREQLAQVFAGNLLMPPPLLFSVIERLGLGGGPFQPEHAYAVAREAGVSYDAAIWQLTHLSVVTRDEATALRQHKPLQIKADLAVGRRPVNGYADVWPVNEDWDDQVLSLRVEDEVVISLPENRSTGYRWAFSGEHMPAPTASEPPTVDASQTSPPDATAVHELRERLTAAATADKPRRVPGAVLDRLRNVVGSPAPLLPSTSGADVVGDEYLPARAPWLPPRKVRQFRLAQRIHSLPTGSESGDIAPDAVPVVAGTGRRVLGVRFGRPGPATLRLEYRSPYNDDDPVEKYVLHALVEPRRMGFSVDQLAIDPDTAWTTRVRQRQLDRPLDPLPDDEELDPAADEDQSVDTS